MFKIVENKAQFILRLHKKLLTEIVDFFCSIKYIYNFK